MGVIEQGSVALHVLHCRRDIARTITTITNSDSKLVLSTEQHQVPQCVVAGHPHTGLDALRDRILGADRFVTSTRPKTLQKARHIMQTWDKALQSVRFSLPRHWMNVRRYGL